MQERHFGSLQPVQRVTQASGPRTRLPTRLAKVPAFARLVSVRLFNSLVWKVLRTMPPLPSVLPVGASWARRRFLAVFLVSAAAGIFGRTFPMPPGQEDVIVRNGWFLLSGDV